MVTVEVSLVYKDEFFRILSRNPLDYAFVEVFFLSLRRKGIANNIWFSFDRNKFEIEVY